MAIVFLSDGAAASGDVSAVNTSLFEGTLSGIVTIDTSAAKHHGYGCLKHDSGASASAYRAKNSVLADAGRRISFWYENDGLPAAANSSILRVMTSANAQVAAIIVDSAGHLRLQGGASGTTVLATGLSTLNLGQWYRIALCYTITSASVSEWRVYLDGVLELTASNPATQVTASANLRIGWAGTSPGANVIMRSSDVYVDDSTALTDPGDIWVTNKMPASLGSLNAFDTPVGTGTNRWDRVNERPVSTANRYTHAATAQATEEYGVEAAAVGEDNLTGATIVGWGAWAYFGVAAAAGSTLANIVCNGSPVATTTTVNSGLYQCQEKIAAVATYPGANATGLRSTGTTVDTNLADCGVLVAYIPGAVVNGPPRFRRPVQHWTRR